MGRNSDDLGHEFRNALSADGFYDDKILKDQDFDLEKHAQMAPELLSDFLGEDYTKSSNARSQSYQNESDYNAHSASISNYSSSGGGPSKDDPPPPYYP